MRSEAATIAEYFNAHKNLTTDAGAMLFGETVTITADGPWQHVLHQLTGRKWGNLDVENETGCGIVPHTYKATKLVNAVQWAVGLELMLLIDDPWRVFLTTDHPNGACFWRYPEIIRLLMDVEFRKEQIKALPEEARKRIVLADLDRAVHVVGDRDHQLRRPGARAGPVAEGAPRRRCGCRRRRCTRKTRRAASCSSIRATSSRAAKSSSKKERSARWPAGGSSSSSPAFDEQIEDVPAPALSEGLHDVVRQLPGGDRAHRRSGRPRACSPTFEPSAIRTNDHPDPEGAAVRPARSRVAVARRPGAAVERRHPGAARAARQAAAPRRRFLCRRRGGQRRTGDPRRRGQGQVDRPRHDSRPHHHRRQRRDAPGRLHEGRRDRGVRRRRRTGSAPRCRAGSSGSAATPADRSARPTAEAVPG